MVHSFYASMGGFALDISSDSNLEPFIANCSQLTLTAQGVLLLAATGYALPDLCKKSILDRSKADNLTKALVCLQAGYMIVQCGSRVASRLPLTFLEVNTLGHVLCALVMYCFWLQKPQDIYIPTRLSSQNIRPLCSHMYMRSSMSHRHGRKGGEWSSLHYYADEDVSQERLPGGDLNKAPENSMDYWVRPVKEGRKLLRPHSSADDIELPTEEAPNHIVFTVHEDETFGNTNLGPKPSPSYRPSRFQRSKLERTSIPSCWIDRVNRDELVTRLVGTYVRGSL
jgi:hypothetical protein